jgi:hypothetical protein
MAKDTKETKYSLPMKEIKSDLFKTLFFAGFAIIFLLILHFGNVTVGDITSLLKGFR